jgi:hypothetical protein
VQNASVVQSRGARLCTKNRGFGHFPSVLHQYSAGCTKNQEGRPMSANVALVRPCQKAQDGQQNHSVNAGAEQEANPASRGGSGLETGPQYSQRANQPTDDGRRTVNRVSLEWRTHAVPLQHPLPIRFAVGRVHCGIVTGFLTINRSNSTWVVVCNAQSHKPIGAVAMSDALRVGAIYDIAECGRGISAGIKDERIAKVAASFESNATRVERLIQMQVNLVLWTMHFQRVHDETEHSVLGRLGLSPEELKDPELRERLHEASGQRWAAMMKRWVEDPTGAEVARDSAIENINQLTVVFGEPMMTGWGVVLTSAITGAWTAFESLAGDLWEQAINSSPRRFARLQGTLNQFTKAVDRKRHAKHINLDDQNRDSPDEANYRRVDLIEMYKLTDGKSDLCENMGTVLRGNFKFSSLSGIRSAYSAAFDGSKCRPIEIALTCLALDALSAVRNLIVHRAAVADKEYVDAIRGVPGAPPLTLNQPLILNGQIVCDLVSPVFERCVGLIRAVDALCVS